MKHKRKCLEKRCYATLDAAYAQVVKNYIKEKDALSVYECPVCLDFHLTKQGVLDFQLRKRCWREAFPIWFKHWHRRSAGQIMQKNIELMYKQFPKGYYKKKYKAVTLPFEEQQMVLQKLREINLQEIGVKKYEEITTRSGH